MFPRNQYAPLEPADATAISYALLRHLGLMLDELSAQGLTLWQDTGQCWRWAWAATTFQSERGFWSIGEAIVDAVVSRFPARFDITGIVEREMEERRAAGEEATPAVPVRCAPAFVYVWSSSFLIG